MTGIEWVSGHTPRGRKQEGGLEDAVNRNLQSVLKDAMDLSNADYDTLEDIADGLEKMLHSWNDVQEQRANEYAKLKKSLAKDSSQPQKGLKVTLEDVGISVSVPESPKKAAELERENNAAAESNDDEKLLPEWADLLNKGDADSDRSSSKRKVAGSRQPYVLKAMPLRKKPRKQMITVQIQDDKTADKGRECICDEGEEQK